jgi:hypothetical protein
MPWTTDYLAAGAYVSFFGRMTGEELIRAKTEVYAHSYETGPRFVVLDYTAVEQLDVDRSDVERTVTQDRAVARAMLPDLAAAAVAPEAMTYGVARMWEVGMQSTGWQTTVVRSRAEALGWLAKLGIPLDDFPGSRSERVTGV